MITLHEGTLSQLALSRFLPLKDAPAYEAPSFDSDDIKTLFKGLGANAQEMADLDLMLTSVILHVCMQERHEAMLQRVVAVSSALALAANPARVAA